MVRFGYSGLQVQYNNAKGPTKAEYVFHPDKSIDAIRASCPDDEMRTARSSGWCWRRRIMQSQGNVPNALERLSRAYIDQLCDMIGLATDIPAPDLYTDPQIMAWMMDEYCKLTRRSQFGVITGKPLAIGGSVGRADAAARGGMYAIREAAETLGIDLSNATVAIQGYGNAGYFAALLCTSLFGCKVVAASDTQGGIYHPDGLDPEQVRRQKAMTGTVSGTPNAQQITNEELLELEVDILIPAARENVITERNAPHIKAKILAEAGKMVLPRQRRTRDTLQKNVHLIPDFLCNAGGVTVSYFEMVQNAYMYFWERKWSISDWIER